MKKTQLKNKNIFTNPKKGIAQGRGGTYIAPHPQVQNIKQRKNMKNTISFSCV